MSLIEVSLTFRLGHQEREARYFVRRLFCTMLSTRRFQIADFRFQIVGINLAVASVLSIIDQLVSYSQYHLAVAGGVLLASDQLVSHSKC